MNLDTAEIQKIIIEKAVNSIVEEADIADEIRSRVQQEVDRQVNEIFAQSATTEIRSAIEETIKEGFNRPFQKVDCFGMTEGGETTIKNELVKQVDGYWNCRVDKRNGNPTDSTFNSITRAEFLMTKICAEDFTAMMEQNARNVTGALKDGFRNQMAQHMDRVLDGLFKVKSLQDQGKVEKPY